ncbi:MAG: ABC transporter permease [Burkholderiales bacterium]|nr:ABC transporter permease [Burkholderiales bacterium]
MGIRTNLYRPALLALFVAPLATFYLVAFVYPIGTFLLQSVWVGDSLSAASYARLVEQPLYVTILLRTFRIGLVVTLICLVLAYPLAFWLTRLSGAAFSLAIACILLPLWTSVLVRTYSWALLLRHGGIVNSLLQALGITNEPLTLLYTEGAVVVAMVQILLPFMVLPIYSAMRNIPGDLSRAAQSLGAPALREFLHVLLPLSLPGVVGGCVMVFVIAIGYFITPALLGGPRTLLVSTLVNQQVTSVLNWSFGSALGATLLFAAVVAIVMLRGSLAAVSRRMARG